VLISEQRTAGPDDIRQALDRFRHRAIISGMHDCAGRMAHEVKQGEGSPLAIELREIGEAAAAHEYPGECCARRGIKAIEGAAVREHRAGHDKLEIARPGDRNRGGVRASRLCRRSDSHQNGGRSSQRSWLSTDSTGWHALCRWRHGFPSRPF